MLASDTEFLQRVSMAPCNLLETALVSPSLQIFK
jgi:hypothetical protein